ncbi:MAG: Hsp70 family protein [Treponemataceae bacterium]|nr:Hsp70 family protein [Treponemataceae bacterium]
MKKLILIFIGFMFVSIVLANDDDTVSRVSKEKFANKQYLYLKNPCEVFGIDFTSSELNIGFFCDDGPQIVSYPVEVNSPNPLEKASLIAEELFEKDTERVLISIPESYSYRQRLMVIEEGKKIGFKNVRLMSNSKAAAIGAYWNISNIREKRIASCVFRNNCFEISIIEIGDGVFEVLSSNGTTFDVNDIQTREICSQALDNLYYNRELDEVLIVGKNDYLSKNNALIEAVKSVFGNSCGYVIDDENLIIQGLAIYSSVFTKKTDILLLDAFPFSIGIITSRDIFTPIIYRNTTIPTRKTQMITTVENYQSSIEIQLFEEIIDKIESNNSSAFFRKFSSFNISGIPRAKKGVPKIEITFNINADCILTISINELTKNKELYKKTFDSLNDLDI